MNTNSGIMIMIDSGFDSGSSPELLQHQHEEPPMSRTAQYRKVRHFWYYYKTNHAMWPGGLKKFLCHLFIKF